MLSCEADDEDGHNNFLYALIVKFNYPRSIKHGRRTIPLEGNNLTLKSISVHGSETTFIIF